MCRKLACGVVGVMMLGSTVAEATDATMLAGRAGFLVEHAHRCGVAEYRLQRSAVLIKQLIAAFALDDEDGEAGQARFDENVLAGALADLLGDPMPSCDAVRSQLAVLEQHRENRSGSAPAQPKSGAVAKPAKSEIPAATRRETVAQGVR
jgi:hypothetical protein